MPISDLGSGSLPIQTIYKTFASPAERDLYFQSHPTELTRLDNYPELNVKTEDDGKLWHRLLNTWAETVVSGSGSGLQMEGLTDSQVPIWDANKQKLVPSGVTAREGSVTIAPDSLHFGSHEMSSSPDNVLFRNTNNHRIFAPLWQEVSVGSKEANIRKYNPVIEKVVRVPDAITDVTNPTNHIIVDQDELFLGGTFELSQASTNVYLSIKENGTLRWRQRLGDLLAGKHTVTFEIPVDLRKGYSYDIDLRSEDSPLIAKGSNGNFSWTISRVTWSPLKLLTEEDAATLGKDFQPEIDALKSEQSTLKTTTQVLNSNINVNAQAIQDIIDGTKEHTFHYKGTPPPVYPDEAMQLYLVSMTNLSGSTNVYMPTAVTGSRVGAIAIFFNMDNTNSVSLIPYGTDSFEGAVKTPRRLLAKTMAMYVMNKNHEWVILTKGYIPDSTLDIGNIARQSLMSQDLLHITADIRSLVGKNQVGMTFVNPDGSEVDNITKIQLVGMQMTDPSVTGSTAKLTIHPGAVITPTSQTSAYAFFSPNQNPPSTIPPAGQIVFHGGTVHVSKTNDDGEYVYILIPPGEGGDIQTIGETGGLPAIWSKQSVVYGGRTYTVYRSPYPFKERDIVFHLHT